MLMQHVGVGYFGYYRATIYAMKHSVMPEIAKLRMKALHFWEKHGINAAAEAFGVSTRTLYWWRRLLNTGGPEALIPRSKAPLVRRTKQWHPEILKEIRRLRTELPNLGKEQIFIRLKPWCEQRHLPCPSVSTIGRMIAAAHDKMRLIPVRLGPRGKALLIKKRSTKPRRPKHYRPVKTGELIGMDAIELRMGELRRYVITMIDEHSNYALALAVPSLNSDIVRHFFCRAARLFPVGINQIITDNGKEFLGKFDKTLQEAAIRHLWTYPYTPKMNAICERFNRTLREQFIEFNEILLFEDLNMFNQKLAEYLVLYNSKRPHKSLELLTPVEYILRENKNCNMWWPHTVPKSLLFLRDTPVAISFTMSIIFLVTCLFAGADVMKELSGGKNWFMFSIMQSITFAAGVYIILQGVCMVIAEIVPAFKGISDKLVPNARPALDCPVVFPYAPNAVLVGFLSSFAAGLIGMFTLYLLNMIVIIPGVVPHFFVGAAAGVFGNATGGRRGAILGAFAQGLLITFLPVFLLPVLGDIGFANTTFSDADFGALGILLGIIVR